MPTVKVFAVDFTNKGKTFTAGDYIKGHVVVDLGKQAKISHLYITFKGNTKVRFDAGKTKCVGTEICFDMKKVFIAEEECVSPGRYMYPFVLQFPERIMPPSFQGDHGRVKYVLEATLKQPWKMSKSTSEEVNYRTKLDNYKILLMLPQTGKEEKKMSMFTSGNLSFKVVVEKKGYMPGETIRVHTTIDNSTSRDLRPKFRLKQKVTYIVKTKTLTDRHTILREVGSPVPSNQQQTVIKELRIPRHLAPTNIFSSMLNVEYNLKVYIDVPYAFDPEIKIPIFIMSKDEQGPLVSALALMALIGDDDSNQADAEATQTAVQPSLISNPAPSQHLHPVLLHQPPSMPLSASNQQPVLQSDQETGGPVLAASSLYPALPASDFLSSPSAPQYAPGAALDFLSNPSAPELFPGPAETSFLSQS